MQFSRGNYYTPMEQEFYTPQKEEARLEKPIIPISELGVTVPEKDPMTGGHLIQNTEAAIRQGVKKLQIVMSVSSQQQMGGRPKAYGKEYRENLKELARANDVQIEGVEMPTSSMSNLSGYDPQHHAMLEQKRQQDVQEVKDAIKFVADVAGGGGVDIWSQEYSRDIYDADWNKKGPWAGKFEAFEDEEKFATAYVVDKRTGRVSQIPKGQPIYEPEFESAEKDHWGKDIQGNDVYIQKGDWITEDGKWINPTKEDQLLKRKPVWDPEKEQFKVKPLEWKDLRERAEKWNKRFGKSWTPEEFAIKTQLDNQVIQRMGQSLFYSQNYEDHLKQKEALKEALEHYEKLEGKYSEEEMWKIMDEDPAFHAMGAKYMQRKFMKPTEIIKKHIRDIDHRLKHVHEASASADAQARELLEQKESMTALSKYAKERSIQSYADLGIEAMEETKHSRCERPIHVGPELGWPQAYGGHPEEFIELIKKSRKEMAQKLEKDRGYSKEEAKKLAKEHIAGTFDTSHMGMWYNNFKKEHPQETEEQRMKRFKRWYMDMTKRLAKEDVVGGIQAVDSATGAHGHLPAGQGMLGHTLVKSVEHLKSKGFQGFIVSEGHEEEQFGKGRILMQTWKAFGADIGTGFFDRPTNWSQMEGSYFGHANPPPYIVGGYAPSQEYRGAPFWSGLPLD